MWKSALAGTLAAGLVAAAFVPGARAMFAPAAHTSADQAIALTHPSPARHDHYIRNDIPAAYRGRHNPFAPSIGNIVEGARLYDQNCAVCHGMMGIGDGEAGQRLTVPPADLARSLGQRLYRDDFFYWSISEGGSKFGTAMPVFKSKLKQSEIWKILTFMRAAFADNNPQAKDAVAPP